MAYGACKNPSRRTASDKVLCDKAFAMAIIHNMMDINEDLPHWFTIFLTEISRDITIQTELGIISEDHQLANEFPGLLLETSRKILETRLLTQN